MTIIGSVIDLNAVVICFNNLSVWQLLVVSLIWMLSSFVLTILVCGNPAPRGGNYLLEVLLSDPSRVAKNLIPGLIVPAIFAFPPPFTAPWMEHRGMKRFCSPASHCLLQLAVLNFQPLRHGRYAANEYKYLNWYVQEKAAILMNIHHLTCNFIRISLGSYPNLIRILLEFYSGFTRNFT